MKLLIHAINGIGLGHVIRTSRIARAIQELYPESEIIFVTNTKYSEYLKIRFKTYALKKDTREVIEGRYTYQEYLNYNTRSISKIISHERPDIMLFDCELNAELLGFCKNNAIHLVYVLRITTAERFHDIKHHLALFDSLIVPHERSEFPLEQRDYLSKLSAQFTGPIIDLNDYFNFDRKDDILITFGSGSPIPENQPLFSAVDTFLEFLRKNNSMINNKSIGIKIITGPFYEGNCNLNGFSISATTDHLMKDMLSARVVISGAGYNTINEIVQSKTPAIVIPLIRKWDDQFKRAKQLEKHGCIRVADHELLGHLSEILTNWSDYHNQFPDINAGNQKAAQALMKTFSLKT